MSATLHCPDCGSPLPADAPQGECPRCLLRAGFESEPALSAAVATPSVAATRTSAGHSHFVPPTVAELQQRIPQYEILELIGQGGMGAVYKAKQAGLGRLVAIKILPVEVSQSPAFTERFAREARALALLSHPHIVAVHDFGQADGLCYFVMEYVDGVNLRQALQAGKMNPQQALAIVPQICEALQYAHEEGVVHRDIKPENILIDKRGRVKIADFGLAKLLGTDAAPEQSITGTQQVMGTLRYMAPEQMFGSKEVDHRADIFSLGVVFYELLTGELPVGRFAPPSKKSGVDVRLDEVVLRALESEPSERYQSVSEMKHGLDSISKLELPAGSALDAALRPAAAKSEFAGSHWHLLAAAILSLLTLWFVAYTAKPFFVMMDGQDGLLQQLGADWGLGRNVNTVASVVIVMFFTFLTATAYAWWTYRSALIARNPQTPRELPADGAPRLSRAAIWGAALSPLFILGVCLLVVATIPAVVVQRVDENSPARAGIPVGWIILFVLVELGCLISPFATTLLGIIAISNIRSSKGKVYGMPLAVFDALLYPLLLLDLILLVVGFFVFTIGISLLVKMPPNTAFTPLAPLALALVFFGPLIVGLDIWLIRLTWRAATKGLAADSDDNKLTGLPQKEPPPFQPATARGTSTTTIVILVLLGLLTIPLLLGCGLIAARFFTPIGLRAEPKSQQRMPHEHEEQLTNPVIEKLERAK